MKYPDFPENAGGLEEEVLARWREEDLFRRTLEATEGRDPFVFYEGPPTANGRPGIHHVLSRTIKDLVCRYQTMRGHHVTRIAGWDTHGLPVEIEAEKKLGISGKGQIEEVGVARFNDVCRESVFTYKEEWERLSERIGYWLDYSRPYVTFATEYIESVWAILRRLHDRDFLYRGHKVVPYCPRCGTALSSHEVAQGYQDVRDPSLYFLAPLRDADGGEDADGRAFLVWTTTPWTLPSNTALAVHPELTYAEVARGERRLILAEARVEELFGEDAEVLRRYRGEDLIGLGYRRPFDVVPESDAGTDGGRSLDNGWRVYGGEFVTAEDGTGIVHLAPAFGADDYAAGLEHGLPLMRPMGDDGRFDEGLDLVGGLFVKAADPVLVEDLEDRGLLFRHTLEEHTYPHCWRCSSPLIYMARDSWYLRTTAVKERMLANNAEVAWHPPEVGSGRMGEWLEGNIDWALSRDRYWGTPLPAWVCDADSSHLEVIGSYPELAERAGGLPDPFDPHKPYIDEVTWPCRDCGGRMRRTPEVIDVWFDSGAMPYAQWHYPLENEAQWKRHFPADFICEGVDQTRGWFYSLLAISTMLDLGPAYRNVIVNDLLLDAEGQKMSKSRGNVVDPWEAIAEHGADAIRWYLLTVSQPWVPKRFDAEALRESARRTFDTLANTYRFYALYANLDETLDASGDDALDMLPATWQPANVLDGWVLSRLSTLVARVGADMDAYEPTRAARAVSDFVVDDLSNWYVRRSRDRFWGSAEPEDTRAAFRTLREVLLVTSRLLAPFAPFLADWLHRALSGGASVHLARYPEPAEAMRNAALERQMDAARTLARLGRAARERVKIRVRQPLRTLHAVAPAGARPEGALLDIVKDELNVKQVQFLDAAEELVTLRASPNFRVLGPRFGGRTQEAAAAVRALTADALARFRDGGELAFELDGERHVLAPEELDVVEEARGDLVVESDEGYTVALDPEIDEDLRLEGLARELVNRIQRLRRDSGLEVSDRIRLAIGGDADILQAARRHEAYIAGETLARELSIEDGGEDDHAAERELDVDGHAARIALSAL